VGISSIYGLIQFFGYDYPPFVHAFGRRGLRWWRVTSFFGNPNEFSAILVMSLPLLISGFLTKKRTAKYVLATCFLLAIVGLLLTGTRTALLGSGVSIVLFVVISFGKASRKRYLWSVSTTAFLAVAGFFFSMEVSEQLKIRKHWWQNTLEMVRDHPLLGTGVGSFNIYYPAYRIRSTDIALGMDSPLSTDSVLEHTHNEFLEIFSDLGILGVLIFLGILFAFTYNYYVKWNPEKKYLFAGNCCSLVGILIYSLYSQNLRFVNVAMFFWLNLALQSALLSEPKAEAKATLNTGKIIASFLLVSLSIMIFLNHSWKVYLADHYLQKGIASFGVQDHQMVEAHLKKAVGNYPQHKWALYYLGISQFHLQKLSESKETLRKVIQLDPNYLSTHFWLANNHFMTQDFEEAKAEYQEALRLDDISGLSYYYLGLIAVRDGNIQQAGDYFEQALSLFLWLHDAWGDENAGDLADQLREQLRAINR
jgi:tetratricopeptide (TPR) repeat protein